MEGLSWPWVAGWLHAKISVQYQELNPGGMEGLSWPWVAGWLHARISVQYQELNPDTVTHLNTEATV